MNFQPSVPIIPLVHTRTYYTFSTLRNGKYGTNGGCEMAEFYRKHRKMKNIFVMRCRCALTVNPLSNMPKPLAYDLLVSVMDGESVAQI